VNGKPFAWIFSSQILEIEAPFAVLAWIYSSQASNLFGFLARRCLLLFLNLVWIYSGQDYHNVLTHNCKLSHGEWKSFGFNIYKPNTWNSSNFCRFALNLFKPSQRFVRIFSTILLLLFVCFGLNLFRTRLP
jgi:hypothetical protein